MREIEWDENGPLVYKKRYRSFKRLAHNPSEYQKQDGRIIQFAASSIGLTNYLYESEWADYIEDFEGPKTLSNTYRKQLVSFDHVLFVGKYVIIFESDDPSHYDINYCQKKGWDFDSIQRRDFIKDEWARRTDTLLIRIPAHHLVNGKIDRPFTNDEKLTVIRQILKNIKDVANRL